MKQRHRKNAAPHAAVAVVPHDSSLVPAQIKNRYDAAGYGKRLAGWNPPSSGPNRAIYGTQKLRDRAQDAIRNDWSGESSVQKWTTSLIGTGIVPRMKRIKDKARKQLLTDLWDDFVKVSDADCVLNFYGQETLSTRTWIAGGEAFIRRRPRFASDGLPVPLQVQILEGEFVPMLDTDTYPGLPVGNRIRSGIELDNRGQRIAYWMFREHPGDFFTGTITNAMLIRVLASDVVHMYEPKRPGQLRGVSILAPILTKLRDIGNYQDAVLLRQQIANLFVAFLTRKIGEDDDNDPLTGKPMEGTFDKPLAGLSPGIMQELEDGQDVKFANPPEAGTTYSDYLRTENMAVASANGLPYETFSGDIRQISDRTLRIIVNEFRRFAEQRQWQIVIPMFCQTVREWWADAGLLAGKINADELDDVKRVEWATQGWAHIHPVQDPQGKVLEVNAGFRSRSSVIGERGDDPEQVDEERAEDQEREEELGITPIATDPKITAPQPQNEPPPEPANPDTKAAARAAQRRQMEANLLVARARNDGEQLTLAEMENLALTTRILDQLEAFDDELQQ